MVSSEARPLKKKLFQNPGITGVAKKCALELLLLSRKTYHVGCWPQLMQQEYQRFKTTTIDLYKLVLPVPLVSDGYQDIAVDAAAAVNWRSDSEIVEESAMMHPAALLRFARVTTFIRQACKASKDFWRLLYASMGFPRSWLTAVWADVKFHG